jgi:hypothetical protein
MRASSATAPKETRVLPSTEAHRTKISHAGDPWKEQSQGHY